MKRRRNKSERLELIPIRTVDVRTIPSDRCLFCDASLQGTAAEEHIFPRWLLRELGIEGELVTPTHFAEFGGEAALSQRKHTLGNLVEGRVCRACNCGWMAELENEARPLLVDLIHARRDVWTLLTTEGLLLARWAIKTTSVLNSASNYSTLVPEDHYRALLRGKVPEGVAAYAQQIEQADRPFFWLQAPTWHVTQAGHSVDVVREMAARSYKVGLCFNRLLLMVAYWPDPGWAQVRWKGVHFLLSSPAGHAYLRDTKKFPVDDPSAAFGTFMASLVIAQDGTYEVHD